MISMTKTEAQALAKFNRYYVAKAMRNTQGRYWGVWSAASQHWVEFDQSTLDKLAEDLENLAAEAADKIERRAPAANAEALAAYEAEKAKILLLLEEVSANLQTSNPASIHWGHVGDLTEVTAALRQARHWSK